MTARALRKLLAVCLGVLLAACGTTRPTVSPTTEALHRLVLVVREQPDGEVTHSWQRAEDFDFARRYSHRPGADGRVGRILLTSNQPPDCYAQYLECYYQCRKTPLPPDFEHYIHDFGPAAGHERYCAEKCMRQYTDCVKAQGHQAQEFSAADGAVDWLKRNHKAVLVGGLIVIAGVVFVVISAGAGVIVLAPVVLVAS